ncbi:hypothetical protein BASA61_004080 [Batrachochytrium salamandrivorans]|nr:hypothetical protein BASA62_006066 [Batrachochytrium salamandrivorans]KAH6594091.1 hypothetical protein BASA61_004080 [Batrachochytrium salamandrivorans]KAH9274456.1 hypothetical protein BASA83_003088 [Batrachochytrium salamandrivorans]
MTATDTPAAAAAASSAATTSTTAVPLLLSPEDQLNWVLIQGAKSSLLWGSLGAAGHLLAYRTLPVYKKLSLPFRSFLLIAVPMAAFFTTTDRAAMDADRVRAQRFSITSEDELTIKEYNPLANSDSKIDQIKNFLVQNKYSALGYTWLGTVGISLAYNFGQRNVPMAQKLINSRMVAQTMVLLGFAGLAALSATTSPIVKIDPHFERIIHQENQTKSH